MNWLAFLLLVLIPVGFVFWLASAERRRVWRRRRIQARPFPEVWRQTLRRRLPYLRRLPADLRLKLEKLVQVFLAEKRIIGCDGLRVDDEMRVLIAAQACLLVLGRPAGLFPATREILVYPGAFRVDRERTDEIGLVHRERRVLSGESSTYGHVVLSWQDVAEDAAAPDDGMNVVIHEFAHQLDQEKGYANGAPRRLGRGQARRWSLVMQGAYNQLRELAARGEASLFDHYGASAPEEFFAVVSEVFFERPLEMQEQYPLLYDEFKAFYELDPALW